MGRRGPKPQSAAVKEARGNPGRRPVGSDPKLQQDAAAIAQSSDAVTPPDWLKKDGLDVWKKHAPRLIAQRLLTQTDVGPFARYCRNFARWLKMQRVIDKEGETYESESAHGKLKRAHPAFLLSERLERSLLATEDRFGINPAERQRIYAARAGGQRGDLFDQSPLPATKPTAPLSPTPGEADQAMDKSTVGFLN